MFITSPTYRGPRWLPGRRVASDWVPGCYALLADRLAQGSFVAGPIPARIASEQHLRVDSTRSGHRRHRAGWRALLSQPRLNP